MAGQPIRRVIGPSVRRLFDDPEPGLNDEFIEQLKRFVYRWVPNVQHEAAYRELDEILIQDHGTPREKERR